MEPLIQPMSHLRNAHKPSISIYQHTFAEIVPLAKLRTRQEMPVNVTPARGLYPLMLQNIYLQKHAKSVQRDKLQIERAQLVQHVALE